MVERNMRSADVRGIDVLPGSKSTSRANGSRWNLGYPTFSHIIAIFAFFFHYFFRRL
jgi:hypothetical protein